jgi:hypothetical protein
VEGDNEKKPLHAFALGAEHEKRPATTKL